MERDWIDGDTGFIDVHVGLRDGTSLPDGQGKMIVQLAAYHVVRGFADGIGNLGIQVVLLVRFRRSLLHYADGNHHFILQTCNRSK